MLDASTSADRRERFAVVVLVLVVVLGGLLHGVANAASDRGFLVPEIPARGFDDSEWQTSRVRLSLLWHSCAWAVHAPLFGWAIRRIRGFQRGVGTGAPWELILFLPIPMLVLDATTGWSGRFLSRWSMDLMPTLDLVTQYVLLFLVAPLYFWLSYRRANVGQALSGAMVALARAIFLIAMVTSAVIPYNCVTGESFGIPILFALGVVGAVITASLGARDRAASISTPGRSEA